MAARRHRRIHDVEQTEKMIPLITGPKTIGHRICELVFGVNIFDLDMWVQFDSVKQPIRRNSVGPGHVSHRRTYALDDHFDHCLVVFPK